MPNEKPNATPTPEPPGPGDDAYTFEVKRREIVTCLKYLAIEAIKEDELELGRHAIQAAQLVDEMPLEGLAVSVWGGL